MPDLRSTDRRSVSLAGEHFLSRPGWALRIGIATIALVLAGSVLIPTRPLSVDRHWSDWMGAGETGFLHHVALAFDYLGHGVGRVLSLAAIAAVLLVTRRWLALLAFVVTETVTPLTVNLTKLIAGRPRPPHELVHGAGTSYPSGHAAYAGATAVALVLLFTHPGGRRLLWWSVAALAVAAMAWSRTYLHVHWLTDALGGGVLGAGISLATFATGQLLTSPGRRSPAAAPRRRRPRARPS